MQGVTAVIFIALLPVKHNIGSSVAMISETKSLIVIVK